jgi:hypothetical protein
MREIARTVYTGVKGGVGLENPPNVMTKIWELLNSIQ